MIAEIARALFALPVLLFLLYVPGAATLRALGQRHPAPHIFAGMEEWLFSAVMISLLVTGAMGLVLAELGLFFWPLLVLLDAVWAGMALLVGGVAPKPRLMLSMLAPTPAYPLREVDSRRARLHRFALVGLVLLAAGLFSRPAEMLRGALDSGVYVNTGVAIARTGAIFQRDLLMRQLNDDKGEGKELLQGLNPDRYTLDRLRMPGFYVYDKKASLVVPQHYSLYPVWIAVGHSLFGIWGALYATPVLMLLMVTSVYFFARRALSGGAAAAALGLMVLCPVFIWFARYPVSEVITGLLAFLAFFSFMRMVQLTRRASLNRDASAQPALQQLGAGGVESERAWACMWGAVAGAALGQIALARPDFIFYMVPVPLYLAYWRLSRTWRRPHTFFVLSLAAMLAVWAAHLFVYSFPYTLDLYHNTIINVRRQWRLVLGGLYAAVLVGIALDRLAPRTRPLWSRAGKLLGRYRWAWAGAIALALGLYALYAYAVAPWLPNVRVDSAGRPIPQLYQTTLQSYTGAPVDQGSRYNLLRIGWYLSPPGLVLGILGLLRWVWNRLDAATGLFFGTLLVVGAVFLGETYTDPHYIYTIRRYLPVILPALIMGVVWACHYLWSRVRPRPLGMALGAGAAILLGAFFAYTDREILTHVEAGGAVAQLSSLASNFNSKSVVLFSDGRDEPYLVATPLQYIFGIEAFSLARAYPDVKNGVLNDIVARWQQQGYKVWVMLGANGGKLDLPGYDLKEEASWSYDVPEYEHLYHQKPTNFSRSYLPWGLYSLQPRGASPTAPLPFKVNIGDMDYKWLLSGFYTQERAEGDSASWRWTGDHAVLRLPWPTGTDGKALQPARLKLRLRPETPIAGRSVQRTQPAKVRISLEDRQVAELTLVPGSAFTEYNIEVPGGIEKRSRDYSGALLHIVSDTWSAQGAGISYDPRALGVQLASVEITR